MALDAEKTRRNAERLLRQGRVTAAIDEYKRLAEETPRDLPLLNLVGDLLARVGRNAEAASYFEKIATEFTRAGFFPKAIAILKKVLRTSPDKPELLARIGDLYLKQKQPNEARPYLQQAAERFVKARSLREAREIYEKMAGAEPREPMHRLRLAELFSAEGNAEAAARALREVGRDLFEAGNAAEAEKIYRRAAELAPGDPETLEGLGRCLARTGRVDEAVVTLSRAAEGKDSGNQAIARTLLSVQLEAGRDDEALALMTGPQSANFGPDAFATVARKFAGTEKEGAFWNAVDDYLAGRNEPATPLLDKLSQVVASGWIPALRRLADETEAGGDPAAVKRSLELLLHACRTHGQHEEAEAVTARLSSVLRGVAAETEAEAEAEAVPEGPPVPVEDLPSPAAAGEPAAEDDGLADRAEGLAVPRSAQDREFVAGRLTQAEVFEKYGLVDKAIDQVREVAEKFPGHEPALRKFSEFLRAKGDRIALRDALVGLALALHAGGNKEPARSAAAEAAAAASLTDETQALLERLDILPDAARAPAEEKPATASPAPPALRRIETPPRDVDVPVETGRVEGKGARESSEDDVEIVLDLEAGGESAAAVPADVSETKARPGEKEPSRDDIEEIAFYLQQGMKSDARSRIGVLRSRGFGGEALAEFEARARESAETPRGESEAVVETGSEEIVLLDVEAVEQDSQPEPRPESRPEPKGAAVFPGDSSDTAVLDEEALGSIGQALSTTPGSTLEAPTSSGPRSFDEQSVEEVFEAFKQHVQEEIGGEDHRTHYDLGIAYKEMGLLDDAIGEFRNALSAPELHRDACTMIALCHREKGETSEAIVWYRKALDVPGGDDESLRGLRYDLADVLVETGDRKAALDLLREVARTDPAYRDVVKRISELERGRPPANPTRGAP